MKRVNGSSCILLGGRGALVFFILFFVTSNTQFSTCNATRWNPKWDKNIKLFYNKLLNRQLQLERKSRSSAMGSIESPIPSSGRNKKLVDVRIPDEMDLGGRAASSAFRLRKKRGSFRLRKRNQVDESMWMNYLPLSYLDTYYALGQRRTSPSVEVSSGTAAKSNTRNHPIEDEKRASFRLKKRPEDSVHWSEPGTKRASFRLKRILDSYKDLMGSSAGSSASSAFRLKKRGGLSSFRLKRIEGEESGEEY